MNAERGFPVNEPIAKKAYYSIGEVCDLTGLKPHVLRYWETQFDVLSPTKNRAGNRVFRPKEIELILLVKHLLYEEKYTIQGARRRLQEMRSSGEIEEERQDVLEPEVLSGMKAELQSLLDILSPPERTPER
jgi:DNA-binding transcriptional MerR regulator